MQIYAPLEIHLGPERVSECLCVFVGECKCLFDCASDSVSTLSFDSASAKPNAMCEFASVAEKSGDIYQFSGSALCYSKTLQSNKTAF